jgi:hypothetical protein
MNILIDKLKNNLNGFNYDLFIYDSYKNNSDDNKSGDNKSDNNKSDDNISEDSSNNSSNKSECNIKNNIDTLNILFNEIYDMNQIITLIKEKTYYRNNIELIDEYKLNNPIALIKLKKNIKIPMVKEQNDIIHIIHNNELNIIYICVSFSHPYLWYSFNEIDSDDIIQLLNKIINMYNPIEYPELYEKQISGFIGNEKMIGMTENDLMENLVIGEWNELFTWGPLWDDHPFRETLLNELLSEFQYSKINIYAMQQVNDFITINVKTQLSKSLVKFVIYDGLFCVYINYNPIENLNINKLNKLNNTHYPIDLPIDIIQLLFDFQFMTHNTILQLRPLTSVNFIIANLLAKNDINKVNDIMIELKQIINESVDENNEIINEMANDMYKTYATNIVLNKILNDENLGKEKNVIKQLCADELLSQYSIVNNDINDMIDNAFNDNNDYITSNLSSLTNSSEIIN